MAEQKIIMKKGNKNLEFKCESAFWYNYDEGSQLRIFLDTNGLWVGRFIENKDGSNMWQKLSNYTLEFNEGILKFK